MGRRSDTLTTLEDSTARDKHCLQLTLRFQGTPNSVPRHYSLAHRPRHAENRGRNHQPQHRTFAASTRASSWMALLLNDLARLRTHLFVLNLVHVPAPTQSFHEIYGAHHLLSE